jgi:epsilon-lactone hydrolase
MSIALFLLDKLVRFQMKRRFQRRPDIMLLRRMMDVMAERPSRVPARVRVGESRLGGVRVEELAPDGADATRAFLYVHGGAFVAGSPVTHRGLTWRLADGLGVTVHAVDYRLAPEHPYPAGLEDVVSAYRALLDGGIDAKRIVVGGDSAGGNLTLALTLAAKQRGLPLPGALVCLSPATDLFEEQESHRSNAKVDAMFDPRLLADVRKRYCPGADPSDPLISPLKGDPTGFPPTLVQCSRDEMLRDDGVRMAARLREAGVPVELDVWPDVFHVWQLSADYLPEGRQAIERIVAFARARA